MIQYYLKTEDFEAPADSAYYLLAANGVYLVKQNDLFSSITEAKSLIGLAYEFPSVRLAFPKVPRDLIERVYGFFRMVYERFEGEAVVFLYYSPQRREFHVDAPPQRLTRYRTDRGWLTQGHVEYDSLPRPDGFLKLGDAHSHGDSPAFFSSVDDRDDGEDGLRIVMGDLDRSQPDVRVSFVANGTRFRLPPKQALEDFTTPMPPPEEWTSRVTCRHEDPFQRLKTKEHERIR